MKNLITILLLSVSSFSFAQTSKNIKLDCYPLKDIVLELQKYKEKPLLMGNSVRPNGNSAQGSPLIIFMNTEARTWTIIEKANDENYCIVALGDHLSPIVKDKLL